ncbi:MAG: hypothetical protein J6Z44_08090 [Bacteroidales bacterium]|nr:hypothetical protein [Bacteroidales bacterium]
MRRLPLLIVSLLLLLLSSCHRYEDKVMAQVYYHKLYESEVLKNMPTGLSPADSIALVNDFIDNWVREQLILHEAEKRLSPREKNFDRQLEEYRNNLLINTYFNKIISDTANLNITDEDLEAFMRSFDKRYTIEKEIVKVNYVKLPKKSPLVEVVKGILFDKERRVEEKEPLMVLLGDSIEYLLDDDAWLYLDDIQNEVSFDFSEEDVAKHKCIEKEIGDYHYLLVILDYKNQRSVSETNDEKAAARMMLLNQRKQQIIKQHVDQLYEKALKSGSVTQ